MIDSEKLQIASKNRWPSIFQLLGINIRSDGRHSACPICGPGRNSHRFRMDNKDGSGSWICTQCGAGDGFGLVMKCLGIDFPEAMRKIQSIIGGCEKVNTQKPKTDPRKALNKVWQASIPLTGSDPVVKYLRSRGLILHPDNIRYCEKCYEPDSKSYMPAMVARIQNTQGNPVSLQRTYLDGIKKADIEAPKKIMPAIEPLKGCAIRLFSPNSDLFENGMIAVAEGIETAMSCAQMYRIATWSVISTALMESWLPPAEIRDITIFGDADCNYAGQKSAYILANKLYLKDFLVNVGIPKILGADFNDELNHESY